MAHCEEWEERIALAAGGDLDPLQQAAAEHHAAECEQCGRMLRSVREGLAILREAHEEPIAEAHLAAVRARVMAEVGRRGSRRWLWAAALAGAVAAASMIWTRPVRAPEAPRAVVLKTQGWQAEAPAPRPAVVLRVPGRKRVRTLRVAVPKMQGWQVEPPAPLKEPVVVKLVTDDPNVVIYWIADGN